MKVEEYGNYSLFLTIINIIYIVFLSFLNFYFFRHYYELTDSGKNEIIIRIPIQIMALFIITAVLITLVFTKKLLLVIFISSFSLSLFTFLTNYNRLKNQVFIYNSLKIIGPLLNLFILLIILKQSSMGSEYALLAKFIPLLVIGLAGIIIVLYKNNINLFSFNADTKNILKSFGSYGVPLAMVSFMSTIITSSDKFFIAYFLNDKDLGYYSFNYRLTEISLITLTMVLMTALYPMLIKTYNEMGREKAEQELEKYLQYHILFILPFVCIIFVFGQEYLSLIFPRYEESYLVFKLLTIASVLYSITYYTNKSFELTKRTKQLTKVLIYSAIANIVLNFILIPNLHLTGAILATILSYIIYLFLSLKLNNQYFTIRYKKRNLLGVTILFLSSLIFLETLKHSDAHFIISSLIYVFVYAFMITFLIGKGEGFWKKRFQ